MALCDIAHHLAVTWFENVQRYAEPGEEHKVRQWKQRNNIGKVRHRGTLKLGLGGFTRCVKKFAAGSFILLALCFFLLRTGKKQTVRQSACHRCSVMGRFAKLPLSTDRYWS